MLCSVTNTTRLNIHIECGEGKHAPVIICIEWNGVCVWHLEGAAQSSPLNGAALAVDNGQHIAHT